MYFGILTQVMYIWHSTCHISSAGAFLSELPLLRAQYSGNLVEHSHTNWSIKRITTYVVESLVYNYKSLAPP
jgi:hypothetical protein